MSDENKTGDHGAGMNILSKIIKTIRTESRELADAVTDAAGSKKVESACEEAKANLDEAKHVLTQMMTKEKQSANQLSIINDKLSQQEALVVEAMAQGDESLAMGYAIEVVDLELDRDYLHESLENVKNNVCYLQSQLEQSERALKELERQLSMLRTSEKVQKATETIMGNIDGADSKMVSAKKSLERIRAKQKSSAVDTNEEKLANNYKGVRAAANQEKSLNTEAISQHAKAVLDRLQDKNKSNDDK
ncbi:PspA/IM30 family protein [Marinicella rhabdoformis]|uniref:PspA/IM30 family protein n=1 Tax=Marinicella rhabdoformis TaxID=2580566 RepID=UPI0012AECD8F|nr:PspA/IM30 family protein [Marinicella rhabdoformis]